MALVALYGLWKPASFFDNLQVERPPDAHAVDDIKRLVRHWPIYPALLIWLLWNFAPGSGTPLQYYLLAANRPIRATDRFDAQIRSGTARRIAAKSLRAWSACWKSSDGRGSPRGRIAAVALGVFLLQQIRDEPFQETPKETDDQHHLPGQIFAAELGIPDLEAWQDAASQQQEQNPGRDDADQKPQGAVSHVV